MDYKQFYCCFYATCVNFFTCNKHERLSRSFFKHIFQLNLDDEISSYLLSSKDYFTPCGPLQ